MLVLLANIRYTLAVGWIKGRVIAKQEKIIVSWPKKKKAPPGPRIFYAFVMLTASATIALAIFGVFLWFDTDPKSLMPVLNSTTTADGKGAATITPDFVIARSKIDAYTITYASPENGIAKGGRLDIIYPAEVIAYGIEHREAIALSAGRAIAKFADAKIKVTAPEGVKVEVKSPTLIRTVRLYIGYYKTSWFDSKMAFGYRELIRELGRHSIRIVDGPLKPGDHLIIEIKWDNMKAPLYGGWSSFVLFTDGDGDGTAAPLFGSPRVVTNGSKMAMFLVTATSAPKLWDLIRVSVVATDEYGDIDQTYTGAVYLDSPNLSLPGQTNMVASDLGRKVFYTRTDREGVYYVIARDDKGRRGKSNPIVVEERGLGLYWGDPHMDSIMGMGSNPTEYALRAARDYLGLDFACVTLSDVTVPFASHLKYPGVAQSEFAWKEAQQVTGSFDAPEKFATITGFDWASAALGKRNVYYSPDEADSQMLGHISPNYDTFEKLIYSLKGHKAVVVPHSSALRREGAEKVYHWGSTDDSFQRLVEVYSSIGASEFYDNPMSLQNPFARTREERANAAWPDGNGAYVRDALAKGHKMGMIAGGERNFDMYVKRPYSPGLTAVWAPTLTSRDIWNSFYSRHVYGTTGARIYIKWTIGGGGPGNDLAVDVPTEFNLYIVGTAPIKEAQIVRYETGYEIAKNFTSKNEVVRASWPEWNLPSNGFYFLRVIQEDGHMAWAGPIWVHKR